MLQLTKAVQSIASELRQSTTTTAEHLMSIPALLDPKTEQAVEKLLKEMATMLVMLEEEQFNVENAL
ncbi:MAG: hypothetical protein Q9169_007304 [Polycauliona sp. 2 TL-2023]